MDDIVDVKEKQVIRFVRFEKRGKQLSREEDLSRPACCALAVKSRPQLDL